MHCSESAFYVTCTTQPLGTANLSRWAQTNQIYILLADRTEHLMFYIGANQRCCTFGCKYINFSLSLSIHRYTHTHIHITCSSCTGFYEHFTIWENNLLYQSILIFLAQILLDDIPLLKQLVELIFYVLITLNFYMQVSFWFLNSYSSLNICWLVLSILTLGLVCFCLGTSTFYSCHAVAFYNCRQQSTSLW